MNTDYCYECDRETEWDADEVCSGCGRAWGYDLTTTANQEEKP